jgi:hypothetical protein
VALKTAAETVEALKPGPKCGFGTILKMLPADDRKYFDEMIAEGRTGSFIADVFRADGHDVSDDKVRRHMRGKCSCR